MIEVAIQAVEAVFDWREYERETLAQTGQLRDLVREAAQRLSRAGIGEAHLDARLLLEYAAGVTPRSILWIPTGSCRRRKIRAYREAVGKRAMRIPPAAHHRGAGVHGIPLPGQCPRADPQAGHGDACGVRPGETGAGHARAGSVHRSGCIAASLYLIGREKGKVSQESRFGRVGYLRGGPRDGAGKLPGSWGGCPSDKERPLCRTEGPYDMIVSNPPYIRRDVIEGLQEEVRLHDPYIALDGHEDGLYFYRKIAAQAGRHLRRGGWLLLETGHDQREDVSRLLSEAGFACVQAKKDLAGLDRVLMGMYNK